MTSHWITVVGFLGFLALGALAELVARHGSGRIGSLSSVLSRLMSTRGGRMCLLVSWVWVGLHLFAR